MYEVYAGLSPDVCGVSLLTCTCSSVQVIYALDV